MKPIEQKDVEALDKTLDEVTRIANQYGVPHCIVVAYPVQNLTEQDAHVRAVFSSEICATDIPVLQQCGGEGAALIAAHLHAVTAYKKFADLGAAKN